MSSDEQSEKEVRHFALDFLLFLLIHFQVMDSVGRLTCATRLPSSFVEYLFRWVFLPVD